MKATRETLAEAKMPQEKIEALSNRKAVRAFRITGGRRKPGKRTGTTAHFAAWQAEGRVKSILQRMKTGALADSLEGRVATGFALLSVGGFKNVWDVSQATMEQLLAVRGIGITSIGYVEEYLTGAQVALKWSVRD